MRIFLTSVLFLLSFVAYGYELKFDKVNCDITASEDSMINAVIDYEIEFYGSVFELDEDLEIKVKLFGDFDEYKKFQKENGSTASSNSGSYLGKIKTIIVYKKDGWIRTIFHEVSHRILRSAYNKPPKWINEGLAEYFEYIEVIGGEFEVTTQSHKRKRLVRWVSEDNIDLDDFFGWTNDEWRSRSNKKNEFISSTLSWGVVYFMMQKDENLIKKMLKSLSEKNSSKTTINYNYPGGISDLSADINKFYK
jgi:hypothetical protein|tara:strand:- start:414 stop:1163 length:750 start_codon:yes stop_codon:yes gene_type:complete